ncbi:RING finger protein 150 isoform X2 [Pantherophis guttatus]|uniref:RING finger protein 150 isoform X2 n=1 Tax=Pantherophis guttatus TaxID=94885 RepID=A0A6P9DSH7_PANGU|nr:RING finger protein 150 isoform X2 [Pantherophis guttatus]
MKNLFSNLLSTLKQTTEKVEVLKSKTEFINREIERTLDNLVFLELRGKEFCLRFRAISEEHGEDIREKIIKFFEFLDWEEDNIDTKIGIDDVVAIMIPEPKGKEIVSLLERNITVMMHITVGTRNLQKYVSRTSVVFVSISFIVLMIISLAWLVFYYIQRFRYANARDRNQRRLGDAAKKAISKLQVRTIRKGDKETESDFDNCAVCIEGYKPNDVVRILPCRHLFHKSCVDPWLLDHRTCPMCKMNILKALGIPPNADCVDDIPPDFEASIGGPPTNQITGASDITVNESSIAVDTPIRTVGVLQVIQDADPLPQVGESNNTTSSEQEPAVSSDSDISLIMAMEVGLSDVELSTDQDCEEVKS